MKTLLILGLTFFSVCSFSQSEKSLVVVNGTVINPKTNFVDRISIDQIQSLRTYDSTEAVNKFGEFLGHRGIIEIKTRITENGFLDIPAEFRLTYGDGKPVVLVDGKLILYANINDIDNGHISSVEVIINADFLGLYGPQAINGLIKISMR